VEATCDRVTFVKNGRVVHEMTLTNAAGTLDVELRVGAVDEALLEGLAAFGTGITRDDTLVRMHANAESVLPELARWLVGRGVALYELRCRRKTLEEWFVEVMGEDQRPG
jgi:ABC-type multidrug transport system ATPase subunit